MISAILATVMLLAAEADPAAAPAAAAPTPAAGAPAPAAATAPKPVVKVKRDDDMLCKEEQVLGTKFPKKVCYTRAQQEDRTRQDQVNLNRMQSQFGIVAH